MKILMKALFLTVFISLAASVYGQENSTYYPWQSAQATVWQNWNGKIRAIPTAIFEPHNLTELQDIVQYANANNIEVKVTGASHSFSPIAQTTGYLIKTVNLNDVSIEDSANYLVRCQTGITIYELDNFLEANGMAIGFGPVLDDITLGGSVSAGCHGAGKNYSIVSDLLTEIRIVNSDGVLQTYSGNTLNVAKVNLGLLGIVYDMVIQVEPNGNIHMVAQTYPYSSVITATGLESLFDAHDSLEIYYFPFASSVQVRTGDATTAPSTFNYTAYVISGEETVAIGLEYAPLFEADPALLYEVGSSGFNIFANTDDVRPIRYAVHYGYEIQGGPPFYNPEYVFGFNSNQWQLPAAAINDTVNLIYNYYNEKGLAPVTYGLDIRFTKCAQALLSPANTPYEYCFWMDILLGVNAAGVVEFQSDIYNLMVSKYNAAPHWPKNWNQIPSSQDFKIGVFLATRAIFNVDPSNIFVNDALFRLFIDKFDPSLL